MLEKGNAMHRSFLSAVFVTALLLTCATPALAQDADEPKTYVVPADQLTASQIAELEAEEALETVETVGKYAGIGKEIGEGVSEALGALNEETQRFGDSKVGNFTMAMIAWKIMGEDIIGITKNMVGYFVGIPFLFVGLVGVFWSYRRTCMSHTVVIERGKGFLFPEKKYQIVGPSANDEEAWAVGHVVAAVIVIAAASAMIFI